MNLFERFTMATVLSTSLTACVVPPRPHYYPPQSGPVYRDPTPGALPLPPRYRQQPQEMICEDRYGREYRCPAPRPRW